MLSPEERKMIIDEGKLMELKGEELINYVAGESKRREDMLRQERLDRRNEEKEKREYDDRVRQDIEDSKQAERDHQLKMKQLEQKSKTGNTDEKLLEAIGKIKAPSASFIKAPKLRCETFSGNDQDTMTFRDFLTQFENIIAPVKDMPGTAKLGHLRGYLKGYAFSLIKHLSLTDDNYAAALTILKKEFDDEDYTIETYFKLIILYTPDFDRNYDQVKTYLNEVKATVHDLKN